MNVALHEVSLCMGISDNIKVMAIAVDETIKFDKVSRAIQSVCFAY